MADSVMSSSSPLPVLENGIDAPLPRWSCLTRSLAALLLERSTVDKASLTPESPALQTIARLTETWLDWTAEDAAWIERRKEHLEAMEAERLVAEEERAAAEAEAVADGKPVPETKAAAATAAAAKKGESVEPEVVPVSSDLALQLCGVPQFVPFLLRTCLISPHPTTHANTALLNGFSARRVGFALLQVACQSRLTNLRQVLEWLHEHHGRTRAEQLQLQSGSDACEDGDEWDIDPLSSQRSDSGFVGLKNQAATCYQNSFLQLLFHTPAFRSALLAVRERPTSDDPNAVFDDSVDDISLLSRVQSIFFYLLYSSKRSFDPLAFVRSFKGWDGQPIPPSVQQDVFEFIGMLFDRLENNLDQAARDNPQAMQAVEALCGGVGMAAGQGGNVNLVKRFFGGQLQNELICSEYPAQQDHKFARLEPFQVMSLVIKGCKTLNDALNNFVAGEMLEGPNAYMCPLCKCKRSTQKRCIVHTWPKLVIFHLKRFEFDYNDLKTKKLNDELAFPLSIDLHPYTEAGMATRDAKEKAEKEAAAAAGGDESPVAVAPVVPAAAPAAAAEENLAHLQHTVIALDPDIFYPCSCGRKADLRCGECARDFCVEHERAAHADLEAAQAVAEAAIQAAAAAEPVEPKSMYRLVGVLVHSGHAEGGHYYSYILSPNGSWHEFNDQAITDFDPNKLILEAFGGVEDPQEGSTGATTGIDTAETVNIKGKRKGKKGQEGDAWQTGKLERSRNAYLLLYERIEDNEKEASSSSSSSSETSASPPASSVDSLSSDVNALSLSTSSIASSSAASSSPAAPSLHSLVPETLPPALRAMHTRILRENAQQLLDEIMFEKSYHDAIFRIARESIEWMPARKMKANAAASSPSSSSDPALALNAAVGIPGTRYLQDIDAELDPSDMSVMYIQSLTLFVLETVARTKDHRENSRLDQWCILLQHAYAQHIGCCQWLLERFILHPDQLAAFMLECPLASTRKSLANLLEVVVKKLIRFELDDTFVDAYHLTLPPLKPIQKREDAQAGLAAALGSDVNPAASSAASSSVVTPAVASKSTVAQSSSSASFLSSALVQSACADAQLAPEGLIKSSAKSTVAVSAKLAVLEGVGKATEKQFNSVGIKTLQNLVEITQAQRDAIAAAPAGGMTQQLLQTLVVKAGKAVEFILELSGVNEKLAEEKARAAEEAARRREKAGSDFVGPKLLPAFIRTCLQTLERIITTNGANVHCCPELCELLANLSQCNPALLQLLIEQGTVQMCIKVIISPITFVEEVRERKRLKALENGGGEESAASKAAAPPSTGNTEDDEMAAAIAAVAASEAAEAERLKKEERKQRKKERMNKNPPPGSIDDVTVPAAAAEDDKESRESSKADGGDDSKDEDASGDDKKAEEDEDDDDDELTDLEDLGVVEMVHLLEVLVRATTTRSGKPGEAVEPLADGVAGSVALPQDAWTSLHSASFLKRLVLQISATKPDPPSVLAAHLAWENHDFTDAIFTQIFASIDQKDFFDFYAGIKILQHILLHVHDSVHQYRVEVAMPQLLGLTSEYQIYYKATELCIKSFMHLVLNDPVVATWCKGHLDDFKWMDAWLGKNKAMPTKSKDGSAPEGQCLFTIKFGKTEGVTPKWEKSWIDQINEYGIGLAENDSISDYSKIFRKMVLAVKTRK